jgi:hypothetical protein
VGRRFPVSPAGLDRTTRDFKEGTSVTDRARLIVAGTLALLGTWAAPAHADALRTYTFEGTISAVDNIGGVFDSSIQVGSPFTMTVTLQADTPNNHNPPFNQIYGDYTLPAGTPGQGESLTINGQPYPFGTALNGEVSVDNNPNYSVGSFYGHQYFTSSDPQIYWTRLDFNLHPNGRRLSSTALPAPTDFADFSANSSGVYLFDFFKDIKSNPTPAEVQGVITSVQVTTVQVAPVPEPGSILAFGAAAVGLLAWRRRGRGV